MLVVLRQGQLLNHVMKVQRNESDLGELRVAVGLLEEERGERDAGKKVSKLGQMSLKRKRDCDWDPQLK